MSKAIAKAKTTPPADRVLQVFRWILAGAAEAEIVDAITATWPDADAKPLIVAAVERISKAGDPDPNIVKGWAIEATRSIYQKAAEIGDHATALRAIRQIHQLSGK